MSGGKPPVSGIGNSRASSRMGLVAPAGPSPTPGQLRESVLSVAPSPPVPIFPPGKGPFRLFVNYSLDY